MVKGFLNASNDFSNKSIERKLTGRLRAKRRHERELERLERSLIEYKKKQKMSKRRGDDINASKWEHRMKVYQNKLSQTRRKLQSVSEFIEQIQKQGEREVREVEGSYQLLIESEKRKILNIVGTPPKIGIFSSLVYFNVS